MLKLTRITLTDTLLLARDAALLALDVAVCAVRGHAPLRWHEWANGDASGVCTRCDGTVVPLARVWP